MSNNGKILFISSGSVNYNKTEVSIMRSLLRDYPPYVLSTRDEFTYDAYHDLADYSYNGICSAFYSSIHYKHNVLFDNEDFCVYNFEENDEPCISSSADLKNLNNLIVEEKSSFYKSNAFDVLLRRFSKYPSNLDNMKIIRPFHTVNPSPNKILVNRPNKFVSINPYSYLDLYSRAKFVMANRVHACVPALSYGKPARLFNNTKRAALFDRIGLNDIRRKFVQLDYDTLMDEYHRFKSFLWSVEF